jgi:uncharacterized protein (DUF2336 family)
MTAQFALIDELEDLIESKQIARRAEALRRVTDLYVSGVGQLSEDQIALFDEVMGRLAREIDTAARVRLGARLMSVPEAPPQIIRALALDDQIEVAAPILSGSAQLDDATLVEGAKTKSQGHLLAISCRPTLAEAVTDVLVQRGDAQVAASTAGNPGARFSEFGYAKLVERSETDGNLAVRVWARPEIPRQHLLKLFANASEAVRSTLAVADRDKANMMLAEASERFQAAARVRSPEYQAAETSVLGLHRAGELSEADLAAFALGRDFDRTTIALSIVCDLSIGLIERAFSQEQSELILILAKMAGLSWATTKAMLRFKAGAKEMSADELERCSERLARLKKETAIKAIQFYRLREQAAAAGK